MSDAWKALCDFAKYPHDDPREPWEIVTTPRKSKQTRKRKVTLARALRQADRAGVAVSSATVKPDGILLELGTEISNRLDNSSDTFNEWDSVKQ